MNSRVLSAVIFSLILSIMCAFSEEIGLRTNSAVAIHPPQYGSTDDVVVYSEGFESGWDGWISSDLTANAPKWHIDDYNAYSGLSWWCGDTLIMGYNNHWLQYLISPAFSLTGAVNPTLTFKLNYSVEGLTGGYPAGYDGWDGCNVWISVNGGNTWQIVRPTSPAYNCQSLYSFGEEWGMGTGIAGWGGSSSGWINCSMNLNTWTGSNNVKIRFALCSDASYCTIDNPSLHGMFVDNIAVMSGTTTLLYNNCDSTPIPSEFTLGTGGASGDWWMRDNSVSAGGFYSATCAHNSHWNLSDGLTSPWLSIPEEGTTYFTFWVWCDMLDWDGDGDNFLEDYYMVEVSTDGVIFEYDELGFYDYGDDDRPGSALAGFEEYLPGMPFNGNEQLDLTSLAGEDVKIRFRVVTDDNNDGGVGSGFHIDDFTIWNTTDLNNDCGADKLHIPFPTSLSNMPIASLVELHNYGRLDQQSVAAFVRVDSSSLIPLVPWSSIPNGSFVTKNFNLNLTTAGSRWIEAYTQITADQDLSNDTTFAHQVEITPEHIYELGYDNRVISWPDGEFYYFDFDSGEGALVRFVPSEHELPEAVDITTAKIMFYSLGNFNLHIYDAGTAAQPGAELSSIPISITNGQTCPNWKTVDLNQVSALQNRTTPFWIWAETLNENTAQIMGEDLVFGEWHYFTESGTTITPDSTYAYYIRVIAEGQPDLSAIITPVNPPINIPAAGGSFNYTVDIHNNTSSPNTFNAWLKAILPNGTAYGPIINRSLTLPAGGSFFRNLTQTVPGNAPAGEYDFVLYAGDYPLIEDSSYFTFTKSAGSNFNSLNTEWISSGWESDKVDEASNLPLDFGIESVSPNPFNNSTTITFTLAQTCEVELSIYDIQGRKISRLETPASQPGTNSVVWDAKACASGVYFVRLQQGEQASVKKIVLIK